MVASMHGVRRQLSYWRLRRAWLRTWRPGHWNPGERRYWRSWISLRPWDRVSKRTSYLRAVAVAELVADLSLLIPQRNGGAPGPGSALASGSDGQEKVSSLLAELAALLLRPGRGPAAERLLCPRPVDSHRPETADPAYIPAYEGRNYRRRATGWLATFNAACFFSQAIWLPPQYLPESFTPEEWRQACAQASIHELGLIHRDPRNTLDPNWMARDPDLEPMRQTDIGKSWMDFIGLRRARAEEPSPQARFHQRPPLEAAMCEWPWLTAWRVRRSTRP
jgi:hypothetical protein